MSLIPPNGVSLRPYLSSDTDQLHALVKASILEIASEDYNHDQCLAWVESISDERDFAEKLGNNVTLLAICSDEPCGFISLKNNTHIDMIYTAPQFTGKGIATFLYGAIELLAAGRKSSRLVVDVSDTAISLFTALKFQPVRRNTVTVNGQWLANTTMQKDLSPAASLTTTQ